MKIVSEIKGEMNGMPLRGITAVNKSLTVLAGALRDISVSIISHPNLSKEIFLKAAYRLFD